MAEVRDSATQLTGGSDDMSAFYSEVRLTCVLLPSYLQLMFFLW
jgi:hypothetical protein